MSSASEIENKTSQRRPCYFIAIRIAVITFCFLPHVVVAHPALPSFDRFPSDTPAEQIAGGETLINELNCIACHTPDKQQRDRFELRPAPVLFTEHNSTSAQWLKNWLNDPHKLKPGTTMPDLLHGLDQKIGLIQSRPCNIIWFRSFLHSKKRPYRTVILIKVRNFIEL